MLPPRGAQIINRGETGISFAVRRTFCARHAMGFTPSNDEDFRFLHDAANLGAAIVVVPLVLALIVVVGVVLCCCRRRAKQPAKVAAGYPEQQQATATY